MRIQSNIQERLNTLTPTSLGLPLGFLAVPEASRLTSSRRAAPVSRGCGCGVLLAADAGGEGMGAAAAAGWPVWAACPDAGLKDDPRAGCVGGMAPEPAAGCAAACSPAAAGEPYI
eukprot:COSAG04_NODE_1451_length_6686_cov_13.172435_3_plen_116_part_00